VRLNDERRRSVCDERKKSAWPNLNVSVLRRNASARQKRRQSSYDKRPNESGLKRSDWSMRDVSLSSVG
jgi:hypothetical protein